MTGRLLWLLFIGSVGVSSELSGGLRGGWVVLRLKFVRGGCWVQLANICVLLLFHIGSRLNLHIAHSTLTQICGGSKRPRQKTGGNLRGGLAGLGDENVGFKFLGGADFE